MSESKPMSPDEFAGLIECYRDESIFSSETTHAFMVALICRVMVSMGYEQGIKIFDDFEEEYYARLDN